MRSYTRARKAAKRALDEPTPESRHEWRKVVKDVWYHQRLLEDAWPGMMRAQAKEAHELSEILGDEHDLSVLRDHLADGGELAGDAAVHRDEILALAERRAAELVEAAAGRGRRLFAESPKAYDRRLKRYMRAAASEQAPVVR